MGISNLIKVGELYINIESGDVFLELSLLPFRRLTRKQLEFVVVFYHAGDSVVTKSQIIDSVWGGVTSPESLTQMVNRVRFILDDKDKKLLKNIPGVGYSLVFFDVIESEFEIENKDEDILKAETSTQLLDENIKPRKKAMVFRRFGYPQRLELWMISLCITQLVMLFIFIAREFK